MLTVIRKTAAICSIAIVAIFSACTAADADRIDAAAPRVLRTPAVTDPRPKIIAFGDSLTAGFGLAEKESYPYLLQERLKADGYDYEVVNAGVSGDTTLGGAERADWVLDQENARIVILQLGANDMLRAVPAGQTRVNLEKIIEKAKQRNIDILFCGMLASPTMGPQYQREFNMLFPDLAEKHKLTYLPFLLDNIALKKELNQADGIHPNPEGTRMMAENVYNALKPILTR